MNNGLVPLHDAVEFGGLTKWKGNIYIIVRSDLAEILSKGRLTSKAKRVLTGAIHDTVDPSEQPLLPTKIYLDKAMDRPVIEFENGAILDGQYLCDVMTCQGITIHNDKGHPDTFALVANGELVGAVRGMDYGPPAFKRQRLTLLWEASA